MRIYKIIDYATNYEFTGRLGRRYTDLDIARFWAIQKSEELNAVVALYDGEAIRNLYRRGTAIEFSDLEPEFTLTLTRSKNKKKWE